MPTGSQLDVCLDTLLEIIILNSRFEEMMVFLNLIVYSDSDWARCRKRSKSISVFAFIYAGGAINWRLNKQTIVAFLTCEAEYVAATLTYKETTWLYQFLSVTLLHNEPKYVEPRNDCSRAFETAKNSRINQRNKDSDLRYNFMRDRHKQRQAYQVKCPT